MGGLLPGQGGPAVSNGVAALKGYDLTQHDSQASYIWVSSIFFLVLLPIVIAMRAFVRLRVIRALGADDLLLFFASLCACAFYAVAIRGKHDPKSRLKVTWLTGEGVTLGLGKHVWDVAPLPGILDQVSKLILTLWICNILYATALVSVKCSIIACLLRVFPNALFRKTMMGTALVTIAIFICSIFVGVFQCNPVFAAWQFTFQGARCISIVHFYYPASTINMLTDLILCSAPLPLLWKLQMPRSEKLGVCTLFGLGFFASAASAARIASLPRMTGVDFSSITTQTLAWSGIEIGVGIFCAAVPALRPLFTRCFTFVSKRATTQSFASGFTSFLSAKSFPASLRSLRCTAPPSDVSSLAEKPYPSPIPREKPAHEVRVAYSLAHDTELPSPASSRPSLPAAAILRHTGIRVTHTLRQAVERSASALSASRSPPATPRSPRLVDRLRAAARSPLSPAFRLPSRSPSPPSPELTTPPPPTHPPASLRALTSHARSPSHALRPADHAFIPGPGMPPPRRGSGLPMPPPTPSRRSSAWSCPLDSPLLPASAPPCWPPLPARRASGAARSVASLTALPPLPGADAEEREHWGRRDRWGRLGTGRGEREWMKDGAVVDAREVEAAEEGRTWSKGEWD